MICDTKPVFMKSYSIAVGFVWRKSKKKKLKEKNKSETTQKWFGFCWDFLSSFQGP